MKPLVLIQRFSDLLLKTSHLSPAPSTFDVFVSGDALFLIKPTLLDQSLLSSIEASRVTRTSLTFLCGIMMKRNEKAHADGS